MGRERLCARRVLLLLIVFILILTLFMGDLLLFLLLLRRLAGRLAMDRLRFLAPSCVACALSFLGCWEGR